MTNKPSFNTIWIQPRKPDNFDDPDHDLIYKRQVQGLPGIKTHISNSCHRPWNTITIDERGRIFTCICDGHVPFPVGHVNDFNSFEEIFNSPQAILTQQSIIKKEFEYCATQYCGIESTNKLVDPSEIYLVINIDNSCNLSCPSCRERIIFINDQDIISDKLKLSTRISTWIAKTNKKVVVEMSGNGDPFASLIYLDIVKLLAEFNNVYFIIKTNGLLLQAHLPKFNIPVNRIVGLSVSIDAATEQIYNIVRRGGQWSQLLGNLEYLKRLGIKKLQGNFVIQRDNINDVIPFVEFCNQYNMYPRYAVLQDWGTWHNFEEHCVHIATSPYYEQFKKTINDPIFKKYKTNIDKLKSWI